MKTALVFSDSHGNTTVLRRLIDIARESDYVIFSGDGYYDLNVFPQSVRDKTIDVVGNCDFTLKKDMKEKVVEIENSRVFVTHGDLYDTYVGYEKVLARAKELGCNVAIYGHSHIQALNVVDGVTLINPGTLQRFSKVKTYVYLVFNGDEVMVKFFNNELLSDY